MSPKVPATPRWSTATSKARAKGGGWKWILSDIKSLVESGAPLTTEKIW